MVENAAQKNRKGGKLDDMFKGNYFIHERLGKGLYKLKVKVYKRHDTGNSKPLEEEDEKQ